MNEKVLGFWKIKTFIFVFVIGIVLLLTTLTKISLWIELLIGFTLGFWVAPYKNNSQVSKK